ncbi:MAG: Crp/Fnr family transcriptional regulator [Rhodocyclaceae bacterium]|jgi:CRP/FNR family transcriptional regulator|nr:Crp/Fnr family transcriptional regulator [Rhodocyclaceae bacterium]MCO5097548.1 Crp/Fnr family transcriptional regulator [Rhodocyclaceae bacterium]
MSIPLPDIEAQYPVLAELPQKLRQEIAAAAQAVTVPSGTTLFDEQQPCQGFPFVLAGAIRVSKVSASGRELPLYRVTPGETCIITSSCLLGDTPYNARGTTEGETVLVLLPQGVFIELLEQAAFRNFIFNLFAERMADLMRLVEEVAFHKLDQRLAALLLGKGRIVHATHQQLADELGSVREMISRLLKGFAEQGLVALGREQIEIRDAAGLRRLAEAM